MRLLLVEPDPSLARRLSAALRQQTYAVDLAQTTEEALFSASETPYDVIVTERTGPDLDGIEIVTTLRERQIWSAVVILASSPDVAQMVTALDQGADDYLRRPFELVELMARLRAVTRRDPIARPTVLIVNDLFLDPATRAVRRNGTDIELSAKEFALLEEFMRHPDIALSRTHLIEHVWDFAYDGASNVVDVYVRYLRDKIDRPFGRQTLRTVRAVGYRLDPSG